MTRCLPRVFAAAIAAVFIAALSLLSLPAPVACVSAAPVLA
jgi:hypothetical protein